ncbi:predicted protein [Verticillium alfalfae VaMs.102]|uniref:Predicted protein n=1 Tax=Verticillium alfalfae (strain VaMs.102 / ATCC MYA-4576 / FGSC 10136) TaxID=526221 RepID=C9SD76_VERA1|nr:predicted protein [Verticillium alfalfae VaMs.102]EEY17041.1 predicted protein [Verticillium alfalfae VaMs.102]
MDQRSPVKSRVEEKMSKWKNECVRNLERFDHIRKALARSQDEKHVVHNFQESLRNWRASDEYEKGVELIARSGINPPPCYPPPNPPPMTDQSSTPASASVDRSDEGEVRNNTAQAQTPASEPAEENYDPEEDLNVHIILYEDSESIPKDEFEARGCESNDQPPAKVSKLKKELETTNVATILKLAKKYEETPNRLSELRLTESLSYVHFPANNMSASGPLLCF